MQRSAAIETKNNVVRIMNERRRLRTSTRPEMVSSRGVEESFTSDIWGDPP
jgi:hypothetical protein